MTLYQLLTLWSWRGICGVVSLFKDRKEFKMSAAPETYMLKRPRKTSRKLSQGRERGYNRGRKTDARRNS
jgi:hypothetical protein